MMKNALIVLAVTLAVAGTGDAAQASVGEACCLADHCVEVDPVVCTAMGDLALQEAWCDTLLLGVNPKGLAVHIYERLGFALGNWQNSLVILPQ